MSIVDLSKELFGVHVAPFSYLVSEEESDDTDKAHAHSHHSDDTLVNTLPDSDYIWSEARAEHHATTTGGPR